MVMTSPASKPVSSTAASAFTQLISVLRPSFFIQKTAGVSGGLRDPEIVDGPIVGGEKVMPAFLLHGREQATLARPASLESQHPPTDLPIKLQRKLDRARAD